MTPMQLNSSKINLKTPIQATQVYCSTVGFISSVDITEKKTTCNIDLHPRWNARLKTCWYVQARRNRPLVGQGCQAAHKSSQGITGSRAELLQINSIFLSHPRHYTPISPVAVVSATVRVRPQQTQMYCYDVTARRRKDFFSSFFFISQPCSAEHTCDQHGLTPSGIKLRSRDITPQLNNIISETIVENPEHC